MLFSPHVSKIKTKYCVCQEVFSTIFWRRAVGSDKNNWKRYRANYSPWVPGDKEERQSRKQRKRHRRQIHSSTPHSDSGTDVVNMSVVVASVNDAKPSL
jgi:hypothetical protein